MITARAAYLRESLSRVLPKFQEFLEQNFLARFSQHGQSLKPKEMTWSSVWSVDHEKHVLQSHSLSDFP